MSIQYLSGVCSYLQILDLSHCHLITYVFFKFIMLDLFKFYIFLDYFNNSPKKNLNN